MDATQPDWIKRVKIPENHRSNSLSLWSNCVHYIELQCSVLSVDISATNRAADAIDDRIDTSSAHKRASPQGTSPAISCTGLLHFHIRHFTPPTSPLSHPSGKQFFSRWKQNAVVLFVMQSRHGSFRLHKNKKLSYCWETVRRESMPRIAEMDVEMTT